MPFWDRDGSAILPYSKDVVFDAVVEAIPVIGGMKIESSNRITGQVSVKTGISMRSWGESVTIRAEALGPSQTRLAIISSPKTGPLAGGLIDFGKNRGNIQRILDEATRLLETRVPSHPESAWEPVRDEPVEVRWEPAPVPNPAPAAGSRDTGERLAKLKALFDTSLITQEEYERKRAAILMEL